MTIRNSNFRVYKWSSVVPQLNEFIYILSIAAFVLRRQSCVQREFQLAELNMFTI